MKSRASVAKEQKESVAKEQKEDEIKIEPITRLEGHGSITIKMNKGKVADVQFNVNSTRFFEKFLEGRLAEDARIIAPRICGICPEPHHLASVKAVEDAWKVNPPEPAKKLRELLLLAKQISSHALHLYVLAAPDFLLGPFAPPETRNVVTVISKLPDAGKKAIELMKHGQELCAVVGGKSVHPVTAIPGGMTKGLTEEQRDEWIKRMDRAMELAEFSAGLLQKIVQDYWDVVTKIGVVDTYYIGLAKNGVHNFYDGNIRVMSPSGKIEADVPSSKYMDVAGEKVVPHCYATHLFYKPAGYPNGIWRAGPLARINVVDKMATPRGNEALKQFRDKLGRPCHATFAYHWARVIELLDAVGSAKRLLEDPDIVSKDYKLETVEPLEGCGVGVVEAPRGTLIHNYWTDKEGIITKANLIVATNHNIGAIEKSLKIIAKQVIEDKAHEKLKLPKPMIAA
ncbi:MAG: Ni/Fe hydrogenase subunit alpha [Promethearchaeati archaeon SRVP18_Atabeyarchaeia-1]